MDLTSFLGVFNKVLNEIANKQFVQDFLEAPAAKSYHQNYVGGLVEHSFKLGCYLYSRVLKIGGLTAYQVARIAICHDFCKVNLYTLQADGSYTYDKEAYKHHALSSLKTAKKFWKLTRAEEVCILLHMAGGWWNAEDEKSIGFFKKLWIFTSLPTTFSSSMG